MGYRLTFYKSSIEHVENMSLTTNEAFNNGDAYNKLMEGLEEVQYNCTNWIYFDEYIELCNNKESEKIHSRLYKKQFRC